MIPVLLEMQHEIGDALFENLTLLSFQPSFPMTKEFISSKKNVKVVTEEILYFLLGKLGYSNRFQSNCWPVINRFAMNEFKLTVVKILEDLKKTNNLFKVCNSQVRKSILDEYTGGSSGGNRLEVLCFELSCIAIETEFSEELNGLQEDGDDNVIFDLHKQFYDLSLSFEECESGWQKTLERQQMKYELLLEDRESLIQNIDSSSLSINFEQLDMLIEKKSNEIARLIQDLSKINAKLEESLKSKINFEHLKALLSGEFSCDASDLVLFIKNDSGRDFFHISFQHENFALDIFKLLKHIHERIKFETLPRIDDLSTEKMTQKTNEISKRLQEIGYKIDKLSVLKEKLKVEEAELLALWNNMKSELLQEMSVNSNIPHSASPFSINSLLNDNLLNSNSCVTICFDDQALFKMSSVVQQEIRPFSYSLNQHNDSDDIDSKYIKIPRTPPNPKTMSPKSFRTQQSLLKSVLKKQQGFRDRLEMIKNKYRMEDKKESSANYLSNQPIISEQSPFYTNSVNSNHKRTANLEHSPELKRKHSPLPFPSYKLPKQCSSNLLNEEIPEFLNS